MWPAGPRKGPRTCVLGTDKGHLVGVRLEADEATLSVHWFVCVWMEGVEPGREIRDVKQTQDLKGLPHKTCCCKASPLGVT